MFVFLHWRKHRLSDSVTSLRNFPSQATARLHPGGIPFNDIGDTSDTEVFHIPAPAGHWGRTISPENRGPILPDTTTTTDEDTSVRDSEERASYPPSGLTFGAAKYPAEAGVIDLKGFIDTQRAPASIHPSRGAGESSGQQSATQQIDWSARSSQQTSRTGSASVGSMSDGRVRRLTMGELNVEL
jgi:hypothetical protein